MKKILFNKLKRIGKGMVVGNKPALSSRVYENPEGLNCKQSPGLFEFGTLHVYIHKVSEAAYLLAYTIRTSTCFDCQKTIFTELTKYTHLHTMILILCKLCSMSIQDVTLSCIAVGVESLHLFFLF